MLNDILWPDHIQLQPPTDQTLYRTRPFTEFWVVSVEHLRRVWHADRGRLLLRTHGPVPFGLAFVLLVETSDTLYRWNILPLLDIIAGLDIFTESEISPDIGFHGASAAGVACRQGTLTPPDTWSRPFGTCICSTCWDQSFSELVVILPDYALRIYLGTFSILLLTKRLIEYEIKNITKIWMCHCVKVQQHNDVLQNISPLLQGDCTVWLFDSKCTFGIDGSYYRSTREVIRLGWNWIYASGKHNILKGKEKISLLSMYLILLLLRKTITYFYLKDIDKCLWCLLRHRDVTTRP